MALICHKAQESVVPIFYLYFFLFIFSLITHARVVTHGR